MEDGFKQCFDVKKVKSKFCFLENGFYFNSIVDETKYTFFVLYTNLTTGVKISFEPYDVGIILFVMRLVTVKF